MAGVVRKPVPIALILALSCLGSACGDDGDDTISGTNATDAGVDVTNDPDVGESGYGGAGGSAGDAATSSGGSAGTESPCSKYSGITPSEACKSFAEAECDLLTKCVPGVLDVFGIGETACTARFELICTEGLTAPGVNGKAELAALRAETLMSMTCEEAYANLSYHPEKIPPGCGGPGSLGEGESCFESAQCASLHCAIDDNALCGTCLTPTTGTPCTGASDCGPAFWCDNFACAPRAALGRPCSSFGCEFGTYCGPFSQCAALLGLGDTCSNDSDCESPLVCGIGSSWTCKHPALGVLGASCEPTETSSCAKWNGVKCDGMTKTCVADPVPVAGEACGALATDAGTAYELFCTDGAKCVVDPSTQSGTCMQNAADGAPCSTTSGPLCSLPAQCISGVCTLPSPAACPSL